MRDLGRLSAGEYEEVRRRQARWLSEDVKISPAPASRRVRVRNAEQVTAEQVEQLRQAAFECVPLVMFRTLSRRAAADLARGWGG